MTDPPDELRREYIRRFERIAEYRRAVWRVLIDCYFQRLVPAESRILDLGCGWGEFINQVAAAVKYGMDLNPDSPQKLSPEVTCLAQDCAQEWPLADDSLDVVFTSNFFEHLPDKAALGQTLRQAKRCLRPHGRIICLGPNIKYLPGKYWDFWDHHLALTELSLQEGMEMNGFAVKMSRARFLPYSMSQGFQPPLALLKWYLRLPFLWRFLGRQFLVIAENAK